MEREEWWGHEKLEGSCSQQLGQEGMERGRERRAGEKMRREICWWGRGMEGGSKGVGANSIYTVRRKETTTTKRVKFIKAVSFTKEM